MPDTAAAPLWQVLAAAAHGVQGVWQGQPARVLLARQPPARRSAVQALLFDVLRQLGRAQALQQVLAPRAPPLSVRALLCTALALLCQPAPPYPAHTLVAQAVEAAQRTHGLRAHAGFINACLRRFGRERAALLAAVDADEAARFNHPLWWIERLRADHPQDWQAILRASNQRAPMTLRVNLAHGTRAHYQQALAEIGMAAAPLGAAGAAALQLQRPQPVQALPGFARGRVSVQDAAAQQAAPLLLQHWVINPPQRALRVLDACAAPGGKSGHLLEYAAAHGLAVQVTALELDGARAARIAQTLDRLGFRACHQLPVSNALPSCGVSALSHGLPIARLLAAPRFAHPSPQEGSAKGQQLMTRPGAQVLVADARAPAQWFGAYCGAQPFDAILLDAPCTASGISARQPDVRWLRRPGDVVQLAQTQAQLLDALWPLLACGGRLLYCTCSVFRAEGQAQMQAFAARQPDAHALDAPGHVLPRYAPQEGSGEDEDGAHSGAHDGFFYALWEKLP